MIYRVVALLLVLLSYPALAGKDEYPRLSDSYYNDAQCAQVFELAKAVYHSEILELTGIPETFTKDFVLKADGVDLSGGDALIGDTSVFQKIPKSANMEDRSLYWQKKAAHGWRYVIDERPVGWRGDQYSLFAVKATIDPESFIKNIGTGEDSPDYKRVIPADSSGSFEPPLMIREKGTDNIIAVDPAVWQPVENDRVVSWSVFSIGIGGNQKHCNIQFYPPNTSQTALLPMPVQKLATLLDSTVGDPEFEGTMQSYARIRLNMLLVWQNVATRPWAVLAVNPYNLRDQVDGDLKKWSRKAESFAKIYHQILSQYPEAEKALALYYKTHFDKTDEEANDMAKKILDLAFRSSYVFSQPRE